MHNLKFKYSVQFELFGDGATHLLCSALKLSPAFCDYFPITTEAGYIDYQSTPEQEFWFAVVEATKKEEACEKAVSNLVGAELEKPFPIHLELVDDADVCKL